MKLYLTSLTILCFLITRAADGFTYRLAENQKVENTHSFNLVAGASFHVVVAKNKDTRKYDVIPFFADVSGNVKQLSIKSYDDEPKFKSCHLNNGNIILIAHDDRTLRVIDYEIGTGISYNKSIENFTEPIGFFSDKDHTIILHHEYKGDRIIIEDIKNGSEITSVPVKMTDEIKKEIKLLQRQVKSQKS